MTEVYVTGKVQKAIDKLSKDEQTIVDLLKQDLRETKGKPFNRGWDNFGPVKQLGNDMMHCHLSKRKPRKVAVWKISTVRIGSVTKCICTIEYIGTKEKAPY